MSKKMACFAVGMAAGLLFASSAIAQNEGAWRVGGVAATANGPRLEASEKAYDFGGVPKGEREVRHEFALSNIGNKDLVISKIRTSSAYSRVCLKTAAEDSPVIDLKGSGNDWKGVIKPGETAVLEVVIDLAAFPATRGLVTGDVFLATNDPAQPFSFFKVSLEITGP